MEQRPAPARDRAGAVRAWAAGIAGDRPPARRRALDAPTVAGPGFAWRVALACGVALSGLFAVTLVVTCVVDPGSISGALLVLVPALVVHLLAVLCLGLPAGVLLTRSMAGTTTEGQQRAAYAGTGCGLGLCVAVLVCAVLGLPDGAVAVAALLWSVLGAAVAGGARWWVGASVLRAHRSAPPAPGPERP